MTAACADLDDPDVMFPDETLETSRGMPGSPSLIKPLLICRTCPVRRGCLEEALTPVSYTHYQPGERHTPKGWVRNPEITTITTVGVWGCTTTLERRTAMEATGGREEALDLLEATVEARLAVRIQHMRSRPTKHRHVVAAMLEEYDGGSVPVAQDRPPIAATA